jgi:hypothetical protein
VFVLTVGAVFVLAAGMGAQTIEGFRLPPRQVFDKTMPRYPNVWFYVDGSLAPSFDAAVKMVTEGLRTAMQLPEFFPPFDNPEGCDFEVRVEHLQPWIERERRQLQHAHAFHMRYYYRALAAPELGQVTLNGRRHYRFAASAHYEVEHANPHHADVEGCPICGRAGEYARVKGNLVEQVHDPLGLELVLTGKIRGEVVRAEDWQRRAIGSVQDLRDRFRVTTHVFPGQTGDRNTYRLGVVVLGPMDRK